MNTVVDMMAGLPHDVYTLECSTIHMHVKHVLSHTEVVLLLTNLNVVTLHHSRQHVCRFNRN